MSSYTTYNNQLEQRIANTSETFYDPEMKLQAANDTVKEILRMYDVREFRRKTTITFDATGIASKPATYFRMKKLYDIDSNGIQKAEYDWVEPDDLDTQASTASYFWTEDDTDGTGTMKLKCWPIDSGTLQIRFIARPTTMEDTTTDSGLSGDWDEAVVYGMAYRLFQNSGRYDEAQAFKQSYDDACSKSWSATKNLGGIKGSPRIKSLYDRKSLLGGFTVGNYDCDRSSPITP